MAKRSKANVSRVHQQSHGSLHEASDVEFANDTVVKQVRQQNGEPQRYNMNNESSK
jgi:hypothetical protein